MSKLTKEFVIQKYIRDGYSAVQIGRELSISTAAVCAFMKRHGIKARSLSDAQRNRFKWFQHPAELNRKLSNIIIVGELICVEAINTGNIFMFDNKEGILIKLNERGWYESKEGYLFGSIKGKRIFAHHLILPQKHGRVVDHADCNTKNNLASNLRYLRHYENIYNQKIREDNTLGVKGVYCDKRRGRWCSYITKEKKRYWLGSYPTAEEAINVRRRAEEIFYPGILKRGVV